MTREELWLGAIAGMDGVQAPDTGAQVVYKFATPVTYQLTPQEVQTLVGQNYVWADTGDVTVTVKGAGVA